MLPVLLLLSLLLASVASPGGLSGQTATVETEENFRAEPNGTVLGRVEPGTVLSVVERDGRWIHATLEGWMWNPSLESTDREDFEHRVAVEDGENLRVEPQGTILARLGEGTLVQELERRDRWTHVRRTAWIWEPSVALEGGAESGSEPPPADSRELASEWRSAGADGSAILTSPDGDTLGRTRPGAELRVLGRRGSWARVRVEGWTWLPREGAEAADSTVVAEASPGDVVEEPDRFRGRVVAWELQFISREKAEPIRTDFYEGEPYLLTRPAGQSSRFVYVAVPPERVGQLDDLRPLERITVVGRVRTGSAALTGGPILDLMELSRSDEGGGGS